MTEHNQELNSTAGPNPTYKERGKNKYAF